ncbi:unnamed protein product [Prunus armeniaca]|uniref:Uncharacterized protein n=1 Tax=Prunus armeniaca TaxID=36596 RepID=A0A6J5TH19_PRUAR|nr:unnamed protein product [Prunus armeniaca]
MGKVSLKGVVNDELLDIDTDGELLSLCDKVPLSYETVVLIYVQHIEEEGVIVNEDCEEVGVALNKDSEEEGLALNEDSEEEDAALNEDIGPVTDENGAFTFQNRPLNNNKEGRHFTEDHGPACRVEDWVSSDDDGPLNNEGNRANICETDVEERNEDNEEEDKEDNLDFVDSAYEQIEDPNAPVDEDEESTDVAKSDIQSLTSSSCDEDDGKQKKRKRKLPIFKNLGLK